LKWEDYKDGEIHVLRKKWRDSIGAPKTEEAAVSVAPLLQEILAKYRANKDFPPVDGDCMFYGQKEKKPIEMDNLSRYPSVHQRCVVWMARVSSWARYASERYGCGGLRHSELLRHANVSSFQTKKKLKQA